MDQDQEWVWKALSDPTRRTILDILRNGGGKKAGELGELFPISREGVAKHLRILKKGNLVVNKKRGRENWYFLNPVPLEQIYNRWMRPYEKLFARSLLNLKTLVEQGEAIMEINHFEIEQKIFIEASPEKVFTKMTKNIAHWWGRPFIINEQTTDLILEAKIGGKFYETWDQGYQGYKWGEVTYLKQNEILEITGPFGMRQAIYSKVCFTLEEENNGTNVILSHEAYGKDVQNNKQGYSGGWADLIGRRLKAYVENDTKMGLGHEPPMEEPTT